MSENSAAGDSSYVAWKGWVNQTPFSHLDAGETAYFRAELRKVASGTPPIRDVLEVGFGNGSFLAYCRAQGWNVAGTELDPDLVDAGRRAGFAVFPADDTSKLDEKSFDLIVLFDVLEHIPPEGVVDFLALLGTKLRPGGRMLLRFPNADTWLGNPLQNGDPTHVSAIGYLKMTYFASRASLELISFTGASQRGFATSAAHGIYSLTVGPLVHLCGLVKRAIYFPFLPIILWTSNVVCVLERPVEAERAGSRHH